MKETLSRLDVPRVHVKRIANPVNLLQLKQEVELDKNDITLLTDERDRRRFQAAFKNEAEIEQEINLAIENGALDRIRRNVMESIDQISRLPQKPQEK